MTGNGKRLREEVRHVVLAADEEDTEVSLAVPTQCRHMSVALNMRWETVSAAMPMATSLSLLIHTYQH